MTAARAGLRDAFVSSVAMLASLVVLGLALLLFAGSKAADTEVVARQVPFVVSGAFAGLGLIGFALGLIAVQARRREEASSRSDIERWARVATACLAVAHARTEGERT